METLYYNGQILTLSTPTPPSHNPEAVLIKDGRIAKVGALEELEAAASSDVKKVDLAGRCLLPAFIDPHSHFVMNAKMALYADLSDCSSFADIIRVLKEYIRKNAVTKDQAVIGFGYDHNFLKEQAQPDKRVLDQVSTEIPILILHVSAHLACANSAALALAGMDENTLDVTGGLIERLPGGREPSGYVEEMGVRLLQGAVAGRVSQDSSRMYDAIQTMYLEHGVTTAQDGATASEDMKTLDWMAENKMLKLDVVAYPQLSTGGAALMEAYGETYRTYRNRVKIGGYKLVLDGSPQGRSAWMTEPYLGGEEGYCGYPWMTDEEVEEHMMRAVSENRQILVHCNGDAAGDQFLNAYEKALEKTKNTNDLRPVMIHCQTVRNDQLDRMAKIGMIASIFIGHVWFWGDIHVKNFGEKRGNHISPARDALDRGVKVNFHQDTPVTKPDMLHSVWCAVNRLSRGGNVIGEDQRISAYEALKAVTIDAAYEYFEEHEKGSIEEGKRADLVILDRSPLEVPPMEIRDIRVLETIKDGETVYTAPETLQ